jgi:ABC-type uncharacterized transport system permease subunit
MDEVVRLSTSRQRFNMLLMTVFGSAALLLAAIAVGGNALQISSHLPGSAVNVLMALVLIAVLARRPARGAAA